MEELQKSRRSKRCHNGLGYVIKVRTFFTRLHWFSMKEMVSTKLGVGKSPKKIIATSLGISITLIALLRLLWLPIIGGFLISNDPIHSAEAIFVLAGDEDQRVSAAAELFHRGYAEWLVLTDMELAPWHKQRYIEVVTNKAIALGVPADRILYFPEKVATTFDEISQFEEIATMHEFTSIIVLTSPYHTRRVGMMVNDVFGDSDVTTAILPAMNYNYRAESWWRTPRNWKLTVLEYAKILAYSIGYR